MGGFQISGKRLPLSDCSGGLFLATMNFAKAILAALLSFIVTNLMGCGCDTEKLMDCFKTAGIKLIECGTASSCYKDSGCCDADGDSGGKTMKGKDVTAAMCLLEKTGTDACA